MAKKPAKKASVPASIRAHVFATFDCCVACGDRLADHCGHIIPESAGGAMVKENFVRLCGYCNTTQGVIHVRFAAYASVPLDCSYGEALAIIATNRAYWATYCGAARNGLKVKPYKPS